MATISKEQRDDYVSIVMRLDGFKRKGETYSDAVGRLLELAKPAPPAEQPIGDLPGVQPSGLPNGALALQPHYVDVVLKRGPGPDGDFVELEDAAGKSISYGRWITPADDASREGYWRLRLPVGADALELQRAKDQAAHWKDSAGKALAAAATDRLALLAPFAPYLIEADTGKTEDAILGRLAGELAAWEQAKAAVMLITEHIKEDETMAQGVRRLISRTAGAVAKDVTASVDLLKGVERELGRFRDHDAPAEPLPALAARLGGEVDSCRSIIHKLENAGEDGEAIVDTVNRLVELNAQCTRCEVEPIQHDALPDPVPLNGHGVIMDAATAYRSCSWPEVASMAELATLPETYQRAKVMVGRRYYVRLGGKWTETPGISSSGSATDGACPGCGSIRADQLPADQPVPLTPPWSVRAENYRMMVSALNERDQLERELREAKEPREREGDGVVALARAVRDIAGHLAALWPNDHATARMHEIKGVCEVICGE